MTQLQTMSDQKLNLKLAELTGWTNFREGGHGIIWATPPDDRWTNTLPNYCTDPAASLEVQAKALEVDAAAYIQHLDFRVIPSGCREQWGYDEVKLLLTANPRERAEAAYMTLQAGK